LSGDGVLPRGEFHLLATLHGRPKSQRALLRDLASLKIVDLGAVEEEEDKNKKNKNIIRK
jgi:hypothetical protein